MCIRDGKTPVQNGWYRNGEIWIDLNSGMDGRGIAVYTIAHELTHFIRQWAPSQFRALSSALVTAYEGKNVPISQLVRSQQELARKHGRTLSYSHALRDNDIRHIFNSHGENTNEKYPVTAKDIEMIPYIVENYNKVYFRISNKGKPSLLYVMATGNNNIYFVEQALENYNGEKLLVNKQIIKTGIDDIPNSYLSTITKKQSKNDFLADLNKVRKEHAQSVNQFYSTNSIRNDSEKIKMSDEKYFSIAEKYRDGTATEAETEQLRKMVEQAAKKAYAGLTPDSREANLMLQMTDQIEAMQKAWAEGLNTASQNFQSADGTMQSEKNTATEGGVKYSVKNTRKMTWDEQMNALFSTKSLKSSDSLYLGKSEQFLEEAGIPQSTEYIPLGVVTKAMRKQSGSRSAHAMTDGQIRDLKKEINNAPAVIVNPSRNAVVYITNQPNSGGYTVVSFDINNDLFGENAHKSTSIHPQISVRNLVNSLGEDATIFVRNENRFNEIAGLLSDNPPTLLATIKSVEAMVTHDNIKSQAEISDKKLSIRQDTEYLSIAEKYRDGTATEAETEQLRKIVLRTAEKNGFKQVNFDYETLSNDLFYGRNRIDKNRCGELLQRAKDMEVNGWIGRPMKKRYLRNQFTKYGATVAYKNEALAQVNPQLLEWLETINAEASNDSIPNPSPKSNTSGEKISPQFSIASDEDYLSVAEKHRDGTATEAETEQLRKMVEQAAKKAYAGLTPDSREANLMLQMTDQIEAMQKAWAEGLNTASQNFQSADGTMQSEKNTATEGGEENVKYELRKDKNGKAKFGDIFYDINLEVDPILPRTSGTSGIKRSTSKNSIRNDSRKIKMSDEKSFSARQEESYENKSKSIKNQIIENQEKLNQMKPVATISLDNDPGNKKPIWRKWANAVLSNMGYAVDRQSFGIITFRDSDINMALNYLSEKGEIAAFAVLPSVLKRGVEIYSDDNHEGRNYGTVTFAGPVEINGQRGNMAVVVRKTKGNHYDMHRILMPDGSMFEFQKNDTSVRPNGATPINDAHAEHGTLASMNSIDDKQTKSQEEISDKKNSLRGRRNPTLQNLS